MEDRGWINRGVGTVKGCGRKEKSSKPLQKLNHKSRYIMRYRRIHYQIIIE